MTTTEQQNNKRIAKNTLLLYFRMLLTLFVSFFTTRIVFNALGIDDYGIYNIVGSIVVFFAFINNGLITATRRYITAELATGTTESKNNVFNLAILSHALMCVIIFVFSETIGLWAVNQFLNIPSDRFFSANMVYQASVLTAIFGVFQAPYMAIITAHEKMFVFAYFSFFEVLFKLVVAFVILYTGGDKLIVYAVLMMVVAVINQSIYRIYCHRKFDECRFRKPKNKSLLKEMFGFMGWSLVGQGAVVLTNQGVSVLINMFFNVAVNAAMGISNQITNLVTRFVGSFQTAFMPQITKLYVKNEFDEMTRLAIRSSRFSGYLVIMFMLPIIYQIKNVLLVWLGNFPEYAVEFCVLTLVGLLVDSMSAPLWMILGSDKNIKKYQIVISLIYSFNFIGAWILFAFGQSPYMAIVMRIFVYFVSTIARLLLVREKISSFPIMLWLRSVWLKSLVVMVAPLLVMIVSNGVSADSPLIELVANGCIMGTITVISIYLLGLTASERSFVSNKVLSVAKRLKHA